MEQCPHARSVRLGYSGTLDNGDTITMEASYCYDCKAHWDTVVAAVTTADRIIALANPCDCSGTHIRYTFYEEMGHALLCEHCGWTAVEDTAEKVLQRWNQKNDPCKPTEGVTFA